MLRNIVRSLGLLKRNRFKIELHQITCIPGIHEKISYSDSCTSLSARVLQRRVDLFASVHYISQFLVVSGSQTRDLEKEEKNEDERSMKERESN